MVSSSGNHGHCSWTKIRNLDSLPVLTLTPLWAYMWSNISINIRLFLGAERPIFLENILIPSVPSSPCLNCRGVPATHRYNPNHPTLQSQITYSSVSPVLGTTCWSPTPAARDSTWRGEQCQRMRQPLNFLLDCLFIPSLRFSFILLQKH